MAKPSRPPASLPAQLLRRAREERLPQAAGGLTFATVVSIVPLLAVSFAVFWRFAALRPIGDAMREHLLRGLLPADITRTMLKHLGQFTGNAGGLTAVGFGFLLLSALALLLSVENTLNRLWQVKKPRPLLRRLGLYLAMLAAGPALLGASLWATAQLVAASSGEAETVLPPGWWPLLVDIGPVVLAAGGFSCLYRYVPHAPVRWREAVVGGLLAGIAFECGKRGIALYLAWVPTYRTLYGAFAPLLVLLLWVYYSWLVTLACALVAATLPRGTAGKGERRLARASSGA